MAKSRCLAVSVATWLLIAGLVLGEFNYYLTPRVDSRVTVDQSGGSEHLPIELDVTFPMLPCDVSPV